MTEHESGEPASAAGGPSLSPPQRLVVEKVESVIEKKADKFPLFFGMTQVRVTLLGYGTVVWVSVAFALALVFACIATSILFPPRRLLNPAYWILAFSIYSGAFTGLAFTIVEGARRFQSKAPLNWTPTSVSGFILYNLITGIVGVAALIGVTVLGMWLYLSPAPTESIVSIDKQKIARAASVGLMDPAVVGDPGHLAPLEKIIRTIDQPKLGRSIFELVTFLSDDTLHWVVVRLAVAAFLVIIGYSLADFVAYKCGGDKIIYGPILRMDGFVLLIHVLALWVLHFSDIFPLRFGFAEGPRDAFMGGCMALSLVFQSGWFAYIMSRPLTSNTATLEATAVQMGTSHA